MHIYEYLFAGVIIIALLLGSTVMVTTLSSPASNASDKDLLKVTAEKIMTQMLLDSGYPYDWGSANTPQQDLKVFGLAKYGQTSRQAYELDPDKVMRLESSIDGSVPPSLAVSLLNLANEYGAAEYGFTLQFNEIIHISFTPPQIESADTYTITVTSDYALPLIGAKVSAALYYIDDTQTPPKIGHIVTSTPHPVTGYDGSCTFTFGTSIGSPAKVLAATVDYYGAHAAKLYQITSGPTATLFQNKLIPNPSEPYDIHSDADSREIILVENDQGFETNDFAVRNIGTPTSFLLRSPPESSAVAVLAISGSSNLLLASRDFSQITYQTINFQDPNVRSAGFAYSLERTVLIGGSTYTATLYFWRMSS